MVANKILAYITWHSMSLLALNQVGCERDYRILFTQLNFQCSEGDIVQIEGPNGSGKTTLLRLITGLSTDFYGEITWRGKQLKQMYQTLLSQLLYIGHETGVKKILSPRENLHWLCGLLPNYPINNDDVSDGESTVSLTDIDTALNKAGLHGFEDICCYQLSAGQQQRVALARLHLSRAPLWVLDEPFTALDSQGIGYFETLISDHARRGGCVWLTTHQPLTIDGVKKLDLSHYQSENHTF